MIFKETMVNVIDNSGAIRCKVIHIYGSAPAKVGDIVLVTIRRYLPNRKVTLGSLHMAVVVQTVIRTERLVGVSSKFNQNAVVLLKKVRNQANVVGTRVRGPVSYQLRNKGFLKVVSLAAVVV